MVSLQRRAAAQVPQAGPVLEGCQQGAGEREGRRSNHVRVEVMIPEQFQIRNLKIRPAAVLAPMAGVTDTLFRRVIRGLGGCGRLMTEFTSSAGMTPSAKKTLRYLYFQEDEHPLTAQLFGANPPPMPSPPKLAKNPRS